MAPVKSTKSKEKDKEGTKLQTRDLLEITPFSSLFIAPDLLHLSPQRALYQFFIFQIEFRSIDVLDSYLSILIHIVSYFSEILN